MPSLLLLRLYAKAFVAMIEKMLQSSTRICNITQVLRDMKAVGHIGAVDAIVTIMNLVPRFFDGRGLVKRKNVGGDALEEKEHALHKDVPQHTRDQHASEIPEDLQRKRGRLGEGTILGYVWVVNEISP